MCVPCHVVDLPLCLSRYSDMLQGGSNFPRMLRSVRQQFNLQSEDRFLESEVVKLKDLKSWYKSHWSNIRLPAHVLPMQEMPRVGRATSSRVGRKPLTLSDLIDRANHNLATDLWASLYHTGSEGSSQGDSLEGLGHEDHSCGLCMQRHHLNIDLCAARRRLEAEEEAAHQVTEALAARVRAV